MERHHIHPELLKHKVRVLVVGCGGNGSAIAAGLPYLHQALLAYGHPEGIHVTLLDPDVISATNCVRQPFSRSEIGLYKSVVLANRLNLFWGLDWQGISERLDTKRRLDGVDIVIRNNRIENVGTGLAVPAGAKVIDLSKMTVLPGLIDCHTHLADGAHDGEPLGQFKKTAAQVALESVPNARVTLESGFTLSLIHI